ncbi:MAG: tryptophan--tRNA ligase [Edaphobacter sp.]
MTENTSNTLRRRVLSGMRPTGRLHLGNYMGALYNWVKLQHEYECYFFIADYHALTTDYADITQVKTNIRQIALDYLAAGLNPDLCTIFVQSAVPQHAALNLLFSMFTPVAWLERVPTYKDQQKQLEEKDLNTYGFLGYPLLQSADILLYQPDFVPVGQDQAAHVELTREVARRFNHLYPTKDISMLGLGWMIADGVLCHVSMRQRGYDGPYGRPQLRKFRESLGTEICQCTHERPCEFHRHEAEKMSSGFIYPSLWTILPEPQTLLTPSPKLPGTDGRKMSKSYGNTIDINDPEWEIRGKLKTMVTDPARVRRTDPGNPDVCPVFDLHKVFSSQDTQQTAREGCISAGIGCIQCKAWLADAVVKELAPIQERRRYFEENSAEVDEILEDGNDRASRRANQTMHQVRSAMGLE